MIKVNQEASIETDLIEGLTLVDRVGSIVEDDWNISEVDLIGEVFEVSLDVDLNDLGEEENVTVNAELFGDDHQLLDAMILNLVGQELVEVPGYVWKGDVYSGNGTWIPPIMDNFLLGRKATQVKFWLFESSTLYPSISIFDKEYDENGNAVIGQLVKEIPYDRITLKNSGKNSNMVDGIVKGEFYKYKLKAEEVDELVEGHSYILALTVDGAIVMFNETYLAVQTFKVEIGAKTTGGMQDSIGNLPKRTSSNRSLAE
ncbi:MAG: hypothetical protein JW702_01440 [Clostridiales bacterium]|nr:hypothetical protein [Clostridiales bacterium]